MGKELIHNLSVFDRPGSHHLLRGVLRGIERECLRVDESGLISDTPHPKALGSSLTNPFITTDFSEALLEFVTPTFDTPTKLMEFLKELHVFTSKNIGNETLWPISMPCLKSDQHIPIAKYGTSNIGKMKELYRIGLHHRYGSPMQIISGIHYNFSMPEDFWPLYKDYKKSSKSLQDFKSDIYLNLIRNVHQHGWLLLYLFGASPAVCPNFIINDKQLEGLNYSNDKTFLYFEHGTSLRMSHLGYQNKSGSNIRVCHRNLDNYIEDLTRAIFTKDPDWEKLGLFKDGKRIQISDSILQIENEYYSSIRPKRRIRSGERPTNALRERGIEYVELRSLDINPFSETGIDINQSKLIDTFLTWCLFKNASLCNHESETNQKYNHDQVVLYGRKPGLKLKKKNQDITLKDWAKEIFDELKPIANLYDKAISSDYLEALNEFATFVDNPQKTYSGRLLNNFLEHGLHQYSFMKGLKYKENFNTYQLSENKLSLLKNAAIDSLRKQEDLENSQQIPFEDYLTEYFNN